MFLLIYVIGKKKFNFRAGEKIMEKYSLFFRSQGSSSLSFGGKRTGIFADSKDITPRNSGGTLTGRERSVADNLRLLQRNQPSVLLRKSSPINALSVNIAATQLEKESESNYVERSIEYRPRFLQVQGSKFRTVEDLLRNIQGEVRDLQSQGYLRNTRTKNRDASTIGVMTYDNPEPGTHEVEIQKLSVAHRLASSQEYSAAQKLNVAGEIKINGYQITVEESDSLASIAEKINKGEDSNFNNVLDSSEDVNGNGTLDVFAIQSYFTGNSYSNPVFINEDINGNGKLDGPEDTNSNERLDGGSQETGVKAVIIENQLVLVSSIPGDVEVRLEDPNGILEHVGLLIRNDTTFTVSKNTNNENTVAVETGKVIVNGEEYTVPDNGPLGMITGIALQLKAEGTATIEVEKTPGDVATQAVSFVGSFNEAINMLNLTISGHGAISDNFQLQSIYTDTVRAIFTAPSQKFGLFKSISDIGISANKSEPSAIDQVAFENLSALGKDSLSIPGKGNYSNISRIDRVGVSSEDNFKLELNKDLLSRSVTKDFQSVKDMLNYASSRLQNKLDKHLNEDYGTLKFQEEVVNFYLQNKEAASVSIRNSVEKEKTDISIEKHQKLFGSII